MSYVSREIHTRRVVALSVLLQVVNCHTAILKQFKIRVRCRPLLFCFYCFFYCTPSLLYIYIVKHRRPYFV